MLTRRRRTSSCFVKRWRSSSEAARDRDRSGRKSTPMSSTVVLLVGVAVSILPYGLAVFLYRPHTLVTIALLAAFAAQMSVAVSIPLISRVPILLLLAFSIKLAHDHRRSRIARPRSGHAIRIPLLMIVGLVAATIATSVSPLPTAQATVAAGALFSAALGIARFDLVDSLLDRVGRISAAAVVGSLALSWVIPDAYVGPRLAGVFHNPNSLGAAAVVATATIPRVHLAMLMPLLAVSTFLSGSRSGALGIAIVLLVRIRWRRTTAMIALFLAPILLVGPLSIMPPSDPTGFYAADADGPPILRTKDNRSPQWTQGVADTQASWPFGQGFGASTFEYSNSGLFLLVETGVLALPIVGFTMSLVVIARRHRDRRVAALLLSLVVHAQFEGWMFAFGSPLATLFWLIAIVAASEQSLITPSSIGRAPAGRSSMTRRQPMTSGGAGA